MRNVPESAGYIALALLTAITSAHAASTPAVLRVPLAKGVTLVSAQTSAHGDRENVVTIDSSSAEGVRYTWNLTEISASGDRKKERYSRLVRTEDLARAKSLDVVFLQNDTNPRPGTTAFTFSTEAYDALMASGTAPYDGVFMKDGGLLRTTGTVTLESRDRLAFSVLLNGQRVSLPAVKVQARFTWDRFQMKMDFLVLADRTHPLLLGTSYPGLDIRTVRIEVPAQAGGVALAPRIEEALTAECRVELPGVYFAFGTAILDEASNRTLADVAQVLVRHPDWTVALEGHTDNIGNEVDNQRLSEARASAVRDYFLTSRTVGVGRITAIGLGESHPRESNDTLEGRARNRRVELVRSCPGNDGRMQVSSIAAKASPATGQSEETAAPLAANAAPRLTPPAGPSASITFADGRVSFVPPVGYSKLSREAAAQLFPGMPQAPDQVYGNASGDAFIQATFLPAPDANEAEFLAFKDRLQQALGEQHEAKWIAHDFRTVDGIKWMNFERELQSTAPGKAGHSVLRLTLTNGGVVFVGYFAQNAAWPANKNLLDGYLATVRVPNGLRDHRD